MPQTNLPHGASDLNDVSSDDKHAVVGGVIKGRHVAPLAALAELGDIGTTAANDAPGNGVWHNDTHLAECGLGPPEEHVEQACYESHEKVGENRRTVLDSSNKAKLVRSVHILNAVERTSLSWATVRRQSEHAASKAAALEEVRVTRREVVPE